MSMTVTPRMVADALRFMGVPREGRDDALLTGTVRSAFEELKAAARPRSVWARFPVSASVSEGNVQVAGMKLQSADLARLLARSQMCYLLAVTLGPEVDRLILRAQKRNMAAGLALDACASVWADTCADRAEEDIRSDLRPAEGLTPRFSPGYGDAPLTASAGLILALDATRRIGLSMTRSFMLTPVKSVTAIVGVTEGDAEVGEKGLKACKNCPYNACRPGCGGLCDGEKPLRKISEKPQSK